MIDIDYLNFLENILTDNRKEKFLKVLQNKIIPAFSRSS